MIIYTHPEPDKEVIEMKGPISEDIEIQVYNILYKEITLFFFKDSYCLSKYKKKINNCTSYQLFFNYRLFAIYFVSDEIQKIINIISKLR